MDKEKEINNYIENNNININNICLTFAYKIIEYFQLLNNFDNNEENKYKLKTIKRYLINLSKNIINSKVNSIQNNNILDLINFGEYKEKRHINDLKNNFMNFSKIYNKNKRNQNDNYFIKEKRNTNMSQNNNKNNNDISNINKEKNYFRNSEKIKIYNSVGNLQKNIGNSQNSSNINIIGNKNEIAYNVKNSVNYKNNIIDMLKNDLKKKDEYIKKINNIAFKKNKNEKTFSEFRIMTPHIIQIIQNTNSKKTKSCKEKRIIYQIIKEINLEYIGNKKDNKDIIEIKGGKNYLINEINNLKSNIENLKFKIKNKEENEIKNKEIYNKNIK